MLEAAIRRAKSVVVIGNGGGGDCLVTVLVARWLRALGVDRLLLGGIAVQWWPEPDRQSGALELVLAPDFYDPRDLQGARVIDDHAVIVGPEARSAGRTPHEAVLASAAGGQAFVLSHRGGAKGAANGLRAVLDYADADLLIAVDVGSDTLSTGDEVRPVMTVLADHLTLSALLAQDVPSYFCLAGYGVDGEMELDDLETNFGALVRAGGLKGAFAPDTEALEELEQLQALAFDPVGHFVAKAGRGEFGLHRLHTVSPWGQVVRLGPQSIPVWVFDPETVATVIARDVELIRDTISLEQAEAAYVEAGRLPETRIARIVDFERRREDL